MTDNGQDKKNIAIDHNGAIILDNSANGSLDSNTTVRKYNIQNLQPVKSKKEARERGRNGGIRSGEVRRQRKTMRDTLIGLLSQELSPDKLENMGVDTSTLNGDYTLQSAVLASMVREAVNGSERAAALIRDTIGEQPINLNANITEVITDDDLKIMDNLKGLLSS